MKRHTEFAQRNIHQSQVLVQRLLTHPDWESVQTVDDGIVLAKEIWVDLNGPLNATRSRALRTIVRQTLYGQVLARQLKQNPEGVQELLQERIRYLSLAAEALGYVYDGNMLIPEAEGLALATLGMLETHENAVIKVLEEKSKIRKDHAQVG